MQYIILRIRAWNTLPFSLRAVPSLTLFRRRLKTELFDTTFSYNEVDRTLVSVESVHRLVFFFSNSIFAL